MGGGIQRLPDQGRREMTKHIEIWDDDAGYSVRVIETIDGQERLRDGTVRCALDAAKEAAAAWAMAHGNCVVKDLTQGGPHLCSRGSPMLTPTQRH